MPYSDKSIKLTEFSHGAGCGCKIAPNVLDTILKSELATVHYPDLLVGNQSRDDAAVVQINGDQCVISTTDFFMPIVDDPFTFGRIAATNAISDIYAMGGKPVMAIAILGWPIDKLAPEIAQQVVEGGRQACQDAGIPLAGGHSIDAPEPIFGLAVTGIASKSHLKQNDTAKAGSALILTKPLGIGILTTAQKQKKLLPEHEHIAEKQMCTLNKIGTELAEFKAVTAMTDITGFGLLGHLSEMCLGSDLNAIISADAVPILPQVSAYLEAGCIPGGTHRNFSSYGHLIDEIADKEKHIFCDPQTSGGLLIAVTPEGEEAVRGLLQARGLAHHAIGRLLPRHSEGPYIQVLRGA